MSIFAVVNTYCVVMKLLVPESTGLTPRHIAHTDTENVDHVCIVHSCHQAVLFWVWLKDGDHLSVER